MEKVSLMLKINEVDMAIFKAVSARYKKNNLGVTPAHARIIMFIFDTESEVCQKDIERHVSCNKSTMSTILDTMEKNGLIERNCVDGDLRRNVITLTDKSLEVAKTLKKDSINLDNILIESLSDNEVQMFCQVLDKIRKNVERI